MPADRGLSGPDWHPQPDIAPHNIPLEATTVRESYIPKSVYDCCRFIIENCQLPDVDAYTGLPEAQQEVAEQITASVFEAGRDVMPALQRLLLRRERQEQSVRTNRWLETNKPAPLPTHYVVSVSPINERPISHTAGTRKSRVSA